MAQTSTPTHADKRPTAVELIGVEKRFSGGVHALGPIDLAIGRGEFVCLVGPSGCGKSTALRMVAGLATPTAGTVRSGGHQKGQPASEAGYVFQEPTLLPWSRVWDNVYLPLRLRGVSRSEARPAVERVLAQVGLEDFAKAYPRQLSGGMKMRASIARALVGEPSLLLMDEPFAALDEQTRFRLNNDLLHLWQEGRWTVIFVTHSVYEAVYLAERIVVMAARPGRVLAEIAVDAPAVRDESFRRSVRYDELCRKVSEVLLEAAR
ncbi:ABC transporter ATP-binding protein [Botrimarina hoheduenensis]|uniref:Bicarbonate transport ATP-binding protein CmpD n=1 Tax=Botrimarina hoheduenensis TaxID=2528000 RepID=A0A5C5VT97_9BACT|nr:ABC transporter ATP-binding protein [Botrimarina hoheduenensis]TWT40849.1 Bicarbonate transport ATP-binding protein CmpD [Botrimarina hoheduenensis]